MAGEHQRLDMCEIEPAILPPAEDLIALNDAIDELANPAARHSKTS